jgi:hypothetical protein
MSSKKDNKLYRLVEFKEGYHDDPMFEAYNVVRPNNSYNIVKPTEYHVVGSSGTSDEVTPKYNIIVPQEQKKQSPFTKFLYKLSHYGMDYEDDVFKNIKSLPADPNLIPGFNKAVDNDIYSQMNNWKVKSNKDKSFFEKDLNAKRDILRKMAMTPELEDILDVMANECIVYDDDNTYICEPYIESNILTELNPASAEEIKKEIDNIFYKLYLLLDWKNKAWDECKRFLIDGVLSYEIVYDSLDDPTNILGIIPVDAATLTKKIEDGVTWWYQYKGIRGKERKLLDAQIIYIEYQDTGVSTRQSYLERLIRPFNLYRIIEQAQVVWTVTQASFKTVFTIPVGNMSQQKGAQRLNSAMANYKEDITFNSESGELMINGKTNLPFNKEYWLPENDNGKPNIETLTDNGPDLNDSAQLKYFKSELYKMSKIPESRFEKENASTWFGTDPSQTQRDEINFSRFVTKIRNVFSQILLKPLQIQLALDIPEVKNDKVILSAVSLRFNTYNQFEEMMNIAVNQKRLEYIQTLQDALTTTDAEGNEAKFFSAKFLAEQILKMSQTDLELNEKYKQEEKQKATSKSSIGIPGEEDNADIQEEPEINGATPEVGSDEYAFDQDQGSGPSDADQENMPEPEGAPQ